VGSDVGRVDELKVAKGLHVGSIIDGLQLGMSVDIRLGLRVRLGDGNIEGVTVGSDDGDMEGCALGLPEGSIVG